MGKGIVVKIWNIKASSGGKSASAQITDSLNYIMNEEKCKFTIPENPPTTEQSGKDTAGQMERELKYVMNDIKTFQGLYAGGINLLDVAHAADEMLQVKAYYGKIGGRVALHGIVSLGEEESDVKNAGKLICLLSDLMEKVFPDHQCVYAVHTNTENLHIHFIVNPL